jgi:hypothetical protein
MLQQFFNLIVYIVTFGMSFAVAYDSFDVHFFTIIGHY